MLKKMNMPDASTSNLGCSAHLQSQSAMDCESVYTTFREGWA